jgi:formylglycine-generating enzyme required for sulfatase activity
MNDEGQTARALVPGVRSPRVAHCDGVPAGIVLLALLLGGCKNEGSAPIVPGKPADAPSLITTKTGIEMVSIPGGEFVMGDDRGEDDEKPAHRVRISPFYMDACEVTQESYQKLMGKNPAKFAGSDKPVERVRWSEAVQYCNMRSLREGLKPCYDAKTFECDYGADGYRLPTEAEWEYACRAGAATRWSFGDDPGPLGKHAWFKGNAAKASHPVKQKSTNPWGLYDMHGNVAEWCNDFASESYDPQGAAKDPRGPASGEERVLRGGSWSSSDEASRSSARASAPPSFADVCFGYENYGFRCVKKAADAAEK